MNLLDAFKQYIRDAMPGGALNPEVTTQGVLDAAALGTAPVPVLGDAIGLAADVKRLKDNPKERTPMNVGLAALGALPFVPSLAGMFVGKGSKTWDALNAVKAQEMASKGVDPRQIWKETGTFKGPDGAWRQEIDDSLARMKSGVPLPRRSINGELHADFKVKDAMQHDPLFAAYPSTADIQQSFMSGRLTDGEYKPGMDWISLNRRYEEPLRSESDAVFVRQAQEALSEFGRRPRVQRYERLLDGIADKHGFGDRMEKTINHVGLKIENERDRLVQGLFDARAMADSRATGVGIADYAKSTQLHELQHAIQQREGWQNGGSPSMFSRDGMPPKSAEDSYRRLAGEAEARATQARMNMSAAQRRELFPLDSYDVPVDQVIIRGLLD